MANKEIPKPTQKHPLTVLKPPKLGRSTTARRKRLTDASGIALIEDRYRAVELRRRGHSITEIANLMGKGKETVRKLIVEALKYAMEKTNESTLEARQLQAERLDMLLNQYISAAAPGPGMPGNLNAAMMVLQVELQRSRLLALNKPEDKSGGIDEIRREYVGVDVDQV